MRVSMLGMGKIGYPISVFWALRGHKVMGYDVNASVLSYDPRPYQEAGIDGTGNLNDLIPQVKNNLNFTSLLNEAVKHAEIICIAVQTPHDPEYEGITPIPDEPKDFNYTYLKQAVIALSNFIEKPTPIVIMSTVLPGTIESEIKPWANEHMKIVYSPVFIAMGSTLKDCANPEFVLIGVDDPEAAEICEGFFQETLGDSVPLQRMSVASAELTKVAYNTYISTKIALASTLLEICHKIPDANVDDVTNALQCANKRITSTAYMTGGLGDGGPCHPRDNIAMSWLAEELELSFDFFGAIMFARQEQMEFIAGLVADEFDDMFRGLWIAPPIVICGYTFKRESNITTGSSALLIKNILEEEWGYDVKLYDPKLDDEFTFTEPTVFLIGMNHQEILNLPFPQGSAILDPFRMYPDTEGLKVTRIGE